MLDYLRLSTPDITKIVRLNWQLMTRGIRHRKMKIGPRLTNYISIAWRHLRMPLKKKKTVPEKQTYTHHRSIWGHVELARKPLCLEESWEFHNCFCELPRSGVWCLEYSWLKRDPRPPRSRVALIKNNIF